MYDLLQKMIAFKYACKINHWKTNDYAQHLLFDRLSEEIDNWVDEIAENYFMATGDKKIFKPSLLNSKCIDFDLQKMCNLIISDIEKLIKKKDVNEGMKSLLTEIESGFLNKLALVKLK